MQRKSWFSIAKAKCGLDGYGSKALDILTELVAHDEVCQELDCRLCPDHAELSRVFSNEVGWLKDAAEMLEYQESLPD